MEWKEEECKGLDGSESGMGERIRRDEEATRHKEKRQTAEWLRHKRAKTCENVDAQSFSQLIFYDFGECVNMCVRCVCACVSVCKQRLGNTVSQSCETD